MLSALISKITEKKDCLIIIKHNYYQQLDKFLL